MSPRTEVIRQGIEMILKCLKCQKTVTLKKHLQTIPYL